MTRPGLLTALAVALAAAPAVALVAAPAALGADPLPTTLTLRAAPRATGPEGMTDLAARLTTADGTPVGSREVLFLLRVEEFGGRLLPLGAAVTDVTGTANATFIPRREGRQQLVARFVGDGAYRAAETSADYDATTAVPAYRPEDRPLAAVTRWVPLGLGALVAGVWLVLGMLIVRIVWGLPHQTRPGVVRLARAGRLGSTPGSEWGGE